jgi:hypothetical protein
MLRKRQGLVAVAGGADGAGAAPPGAAPPPGSPIGVQLSPREPVKRGAYGQHAPGNKHRAASAVLFGGSGLRPAARDFGVPVTSLHRTVTVARIQGWTAGDLQSLAAGGRAAAAAPAAAPPDQHAAGPGAAAPEGGGKAH